MLVEDDKSLREIYSVRLAAEGYTIVSAGDGEEALAMAIKERPDLILSDVMMPKISGFDMLDILRATPETKDVKVVMMTALSSEDQRARGEALGANRYLVKSQVGIEDVVRTVHDVLVDVPTQQTAPKTSFFNKSPSPTSPNMPIEASQPDIQQPVKTAGQDIIMAQPTVQQPDQPVIDPQPTPVSDNTQPKMQPQTNVQQINVINPDISTETPDAPIQPADIPSPAPVPEPNYVPAPGFEPTIELPNPAFAPDGSKIVVDANPEPEIPSSTSTINPVTVQNNTVDSNKTSQQPQQPEPELPKPTAPFSTPAPASLGNQIVNPISQPPQSVKPDISALMDKELNGDNNSAPSQQPPIR